MQLLPTNNAARNGLKSQDIFKGEMSTPGGGGDELLGGKPGIYGLLCTLSILSHPFNTIPPFQYCPPVMGTITHPTNSTLPPLVITTTPPPHRLHTNTSCDHHQPLNQPPPPSPTQAVKSVPMVTFTARGGSGFLCTTAPRPCTSPTLWWPTRTISAGCLR